MKVAVIFNPQATGFNKTVLEKAYTNFRDQNMDVEMYESIYSGKTPELIKQVNQDNDIIVTLGGDGTLGEAFDGFNQTNQGAFYIHIPTGTANDTADNLNLLKGSPIDSLDLYGNLKECKEVDVDLITANNTSFGYVSCTGAFTNLTYNTPKLFKQTLGKLGYYSFAGLTGITTLKDIIKPKLKISYIKNKQKITTDALAFFVSNSKTFGGFKLFKDAKINDGVFEVSILKKLPKKQLPKILKDLFTNDGKDFDISAYPEYIDSFKTDKFNVTMLKGNKKVDFNHDGDKKTIFLDEQNIEYKVNKKVKMLLPQ